MSIHPVPTVLLLGAAVLLLLLGVGLLLRGRLVRRTAASFRDRAVPVVATVVGLEAKDLSLAAEPDTRYFPRVTFRPEGAAADIEAQTLTDVPAPPPRVGDRLEVVYDPEHPDRVDVAATEATVDGAGRTWTLLARLVLLVAVGIAVAWLVLVLVVWTS